MLDLVGKLVKLQSELSSPLDAIPPRILARFNQSLSLPTFPLSSFASNLCHVIQQHLPYLLLVRIFKIIIMLTLFSDAIYILKQLRYQSLRRTFLGLLQLLLCHLRFNGSFLHASGDSIELVRGISEDLGAWPA